MGFLSKFENRMEDTFEGAAQGLSKAPISPVQIAKKAEKQMRRGKMVGAGKQYAPTLYTVFVNPDDDARLFGYYPTLAGETETYLRAKAAEEGLVMDGQPLVRFIVDDNLKSGKFDVVAEAVSRPIIAQLRDEEMQRYGLSSNGNAPRAQAPAYNPAPQQAYDNGFNQGYDQGYDQGFDDFNNADMSPDDYDDYDDYDNNAAPSNDNFDFNYDPDEIDMEEAFEPREDFGVDDPDNTRKPPLPYVPEDEIDYSIDYGEYTFDSEDFEDYRRNSERLGAHGAHGAVAPSAAAVAAASADAHMHAPQTVAFSGGATPNANAVRARLIDLAYQREYDLSGTRVTMGRSSSNDIVVQDINCSRQHAELRLTPQGVWTITDLRSVNGTVVNGAPIASQPLYTGDRITLGKTDFEFLQG